MASLMTKSNVLPVYYRSKAIDFEKHSLDLSII